MSPHLPLLCRPPAELGSPLQPTPKEALQTLLDPQVKWEEGHGTGQPEAVPQVGGGVDEPGSTFPLSTLHSPALGFQALVCFLHGYVLGVGQGCWVT